MSRRGDILGASFLLSLLTCRYYLGISPSRLERYYAHPSIAEKLFASNTMHLFSTDPVGVDFTLTSTYRLLHSTTGRPPFRRHINESLCLSRILLGDGLADRLALPRVSLVRRARTRVGFLMQRAIHAFGERYRPGWEAERVRATRLLVLMVVCWQLGTKRTRFTVKRGGGHVLGSGTGDEEDEDGDELDPEVKMGPAAGKEVVWRWKRLLYEMGAVCGGLVVMGALAGWASWRVARVWVV